MGALTEVVPCPACFLLEKCRAFVIFVFLFDLRYSSLPPTLLHGEHFSNPIDVNDMSDDDTASYFFSNIFPDTSLFPQDDYGLFQCSFQLTVYFLIELFASLLLVKKKPFCNRHWSVLTYSLIITGLWVWIAYFGSGDCPDRG